MVDRGRAIGEMFSPSLVLEPIGGKGKKGKAKGPAEEYEEYGEKEIRMGKWDYVGGKEKPEERRITMDPERDENRESRYEFQQRNRERSRAVKRGGN